jgi:Cft2 family RNA processing exonuclease
MESADTRLESHLIDGALALDAGSLTRSTTFEEQAGIRAILLSHRHYDHVRDLPLLGLAVRNLGQTIDVYGIPDTLDAVREKLLDGRIYPVFVDAPEGQNPVYRLNPVEPGQPFEVLDYTVTAYPVPHAVPAVGYHIQGADTSLFYTGDAGAGVGAAWEHIAPDVLLTEVTFGNEGTQAADRAGHLTPDYLARELGLYHDRHGRYPRVVVAHMNPPWERVIREELAALASDLGLDLTVATADMTLEL